MTIHTDANTCLICGKGPCKRKSFDLLYYRITDWICEACYMIDTDEWKESPTW